MNGPLTVLNIIQELKLQTAPPLLPLSWIPSTSPAPAAVPFHCRSFSFILDPNFIHRHKKVDLGGSLTATRQTDPALYIGQLPYRDFVFLSHYKPGGHLPTSHIYKPDKLPDPPIFSVKE